MPYQSVFAVLSAFSLPFSKNWLMSPAPQITKSVNLETGKDPDKKAGHHGNESTA